MLKTIGVNTRHIIKISTQAKEQHIKELAIIEIMAKKIAKVVVNRQSYSEKINPNATDIFDKISINLLVQRLSQLLKIPIASFESIDFKSPDPFASIEIPLIITKL